jgi:Ca2+-binding RTX toxin-like protein
VVAGGDGDDRLTAAADGSADVFDGGAGRDVLDLSAAGRLTLDLAAGRASGARTGEDAVRRVETVIAGGGDDSLTGSDADEGLLGGDGDDRLDGRAGEDTLDGGAGCDALFGGDGHDLISGGAGADTLRGAAGADTLLGGDGADDVAGGAGDDLLVGGEGDDVLDGGAGDVVLLGGAGDDVLRDGAGSDVVRGGDGEDRVVAALDAAADAYDGGAGEDTLDLSAATLGLRVDLVAGQVSGIEVGEDTISGFERVQGGAGDDHFLAGSQPVTLAGGGGSNVFEFAPEAGAAGLVAALHEILDFRLGDRIRLAQVDLFERALERFEDRFESVYGDADDDRPSVRWRLEEIDGGATRTTVEADFDCDDTYEMTIVLGGRHLLSLVETS